ncbi:MAG: bifunctional fucokinase/L-fucose-1-P-guanylyltransferase [Lachnospiraceae bacterium]|nr:bifunctional fucokinase/L-fucose-1-P-guanylyltransferase [Lachnospiraceae bacterium]
MQHLFLQQSYLDCYESYEKNLHSGTVIGWDYVVLTASNEGQAKGYREQIAYRLEQNRLSDRTKYVVLPDPDGKRVGSGGATLNVLRYIAQEEKGQEDPFAGKRILVIHSGGDSKRVPQYSACGKLFSPVPRCLPDGSPSTLFDEFIIGMAGVAGRLKEGMLVLSGDVLLLFNPLQIDFTFTGAAALSIKEPVAVGKNHGVFLSDGREYVGRFLHKQSEESLMRLGAVNDRGMVDLDTGAVAMDISLMHALYSLVCKDGTFSRERFETFVNEKARISFYGDFLYPLAGESGYEDYLQEAAEGEICPELLACRKEIWEALHSYQMRLISLSPAEFIHFGTTGELLRLMTREVEDYSFLGWSRSVLCNIARADLASYNSMLEEDAQIGPFVYTENCHIHPGVKVGAGSIVSGLELGSEKGEKIEIPAGVVLHGLILQGGKYVVRIYPVDANPKEACRKYLAKEIAEMVGEDMPLWEAPLYPVCRDMGSAVTGALVSWRVMQGQADGEELTWWSQQDRISLRESYGREDSELYLKWVHDLEERIRVKCFADQLMKQIPWNQALAAFGDRGITENQKQLLEQLAQNGEFSLKMRIYYALMQYENMTGGCGETYGALCFGAIREHVCKDMTVGLQTKGKYRICREEVHVELPLRVNWGGGWSDTPPHCIEQGAAVLNAAVKIKGIYPVQVTARRLDEYKIVMTSEDVGAYGEAYTTEEIQNCGNPYDPFALHKAALLACGLIPRKGGCLEEILKELGGGIFLSTQVVGIPKGSGLGTSSILAGACVKALSQLVGEELPAKEIYSVVSGLEQLMSTGGGWQDQVGGLTGGIKFCTSGPGAKQEIKVEQVEVAPETMEELSRRFALIYTGQRRLARNLLREVVGNYIGSRPESLEVLFRIQRIAALMRFELEKGNIDQLAQLFNEHWCFSKKLDEGSSNTCIEQIFRACEDLIDGRFIAGAGGGGFLQVILKKHVSKEQLQQRLSEVFQDSGVAVWECEFC